MTLADLRAIVDAAASVARDPAIVEPLVKSTGLSPEGVRLALVEHLELDATDAELEGVLAAARTVPRVHVILSANVFVAPLRALVLARAGAPVVTVRPSRREPVFATALVDRLASSHVRLDGPEIESLVEGEIHVYGRDETIADVRHRARVPVVGHGAGMGIAFVPDGSDLAAAATQLSRDVIAFDQRGCLSPRVAFVEGDVSTFATLLFEALEARAETVPRGTLGDDEIADATRYADSITFAGVLHRGTSSLVGVADALVVPPAGRHVHVVRWDPRMLEPIARFVVTVGAPTLDAAAAIAPPHARRAILGQMQRPRLDGPVDRRP